VILPERLDQKTNITKRETGNNVLTESRYNSACDNMELRELVWKLYRRKTWKRFTVLR
jgi:hypothetical protein